MADLAALTLKIASGQAEAAAKRTQGSLSRLDSTANMVGQSFQRLGIRMTAAITAPFALAARSAIKASAEFEKARISFGVFVGDVEKGAAVFDDLVQLAAKTPLNVSSLQQASQILLATGTATADTLIPLLENLGNVARADSTILQRLALNLGQVASQGKLTGRELRDFAVAGVPLLQTLAKQMGKSTAEIQDLVSKGTVGLDDVTKAFASMTAEGGKFEGLMEKLSNTLAGRFTTAVDNVRITLSTFADLFTEELKGVLSIVINTAQAFGRLSPEIKRAAVIAGSIAAAIGPVLLGISGIIGFAAAIKFAFVTLGITLVPILIVLTKIVLVVGAIALAAEGLRRAFGLTWSEIGNGLTDFVKKTAGFLSNFGTNWGMLIDWIGKNWKNLMIDLSANAIIFTKNFIDNIVIGFNGISGILGAFFGWFVDEFTVAFNKVTKNLMKWAKKLTGFFLEFGRSVASAVAAGIIGSDFKIPDFLGRFAKGALSTGDLKDRIQAQIDAINFTSLTKGFQKSTESLPAFLTVFASGIEAAGAAAASMALGLAGSPLWGDFATIRAGAGGADGGGISSRLAGALEAGSADAFKILAGQRDQEGKKTQKRNLDANQKTAFGINRLNADGIKLKGVATVGSF